MSPSVATDLGVFDNYTAQGHVKAEPEQHAHRLLPARSEAETEARALDARAAGVDSGAGQRLVDLQGRVAVGAQQPRVPRRQRRPLRLDWPMVPAVDPAVRTCRRSIRSDHRPADRRGLECVHDGAQQAAGEGAADLLRAGARAGSHDFKFGFEDIYDSYHFGINGTSGSVPAVVSRARARRRPTASASSTSALPATTATAGLRRRTSISTTPVYAQDRWAPNNRLSITGGVRVDYQDVGYRTACASRHLRLDVRRWPQAGDGGRSSRPRPTCPARRS